MSTPVERSGRRPSAEAILPQQDSKNSAGSGPMSAAPGEVAQRAARAGSDAGARAEGSGLRDRKVDVKADNELKRDGKRTDLHNPVKHMLQAHDRQIALQFLRSRHDWKGMDAEQCVHLRSNLEHLTLDKLVKAIGRQQITVQGVPVEAVGNALHDLISKTPVAASVRFLLEEATFGRDPSQDLVDRMLESFKDPPAGSGIAAEKWSALMADVRSARQGASLSNVFLAARDEVNKALSSQARLIDAAMDEVRLMVDEIAREQAKSFWAAERHGQGQGAGDRKQAWPAEQGRPARSAEVAGTRIEQLLANLGGTPALRRATCEELLIIAGSGRGASIIVEKMASGLMQFAHDAVEEGARNGPAIQLLYKLASSSASDSCCKTIYAGLTGEGLTALVRAAMTHGEGPNIALDLLTRLSATLKECVPDILSCLKGANMGVLIPLAFDQSHPKALQLLSNLVRADALLHEGIRNGLNPVRWQTLEANALGRNLQSKSAVGLLSALCEGRDGASGAQSVMQNLCAAGVRTLIYSDRADHRNLLERLSRAANFRPVVLEKLGPAGLVALINSGMAATSAASTRALGLLAKLASHPDGSQRIADAFGTPRALKNLAGKLVGPGEAPLTTVRLLSELARGDADIKGRIFAALGAAGLRAVAKMSFDSHGILVAGPAKVLIDSLSEGNEVRRKACDKMLSNVAEALYKAREKEFLSRLR